MSNADARRAIIVANGVAVKLEAMAVQVREAALALVERPNPGAFIKHCVTGEICVVKMDQGGQFKLDPHAGMRTAPGSQEEWANWDILQQAPSPAVRGVI